METTMDCCESRSSPVPSRRSLLLGGASFAAWAYLPKFARAADGRDPRLVVVILRGALDGLATVAPIGDPDYAGLHGSIALSSSGPKAASMLEFVLRPASGDAGDSSRMYREKKAAVVHAVASPYRERSHFDGQDVLESGYGGPGRVQSGWLNRALEVLPKGERVDERARDRPDHAAGAARRGADGGVGAGRRCRRPPTTPRCGWSISIPIAIPRWRGRCRRACSSTRPRKATT